MPYKDPEKQRASQHASYLKSREKNREKRNKYHGDYKKKIYRWYVSHKRSLHCQRCGYSFEDFPAVCEFHHENDLLKSPKGGVNYHARYSSWRRLKNELSITIPLCANCHREVHACVK
jgi:hypothetical protein